MTRPRFSIRTLLILVWLVGLYFGCWELTKRGNRPIDKSLITGEVRFHGEPANNRVVLVAFKPVNENQNPWVFAKSDLAGTFNAWVEQGQYYARCGSELWCVDHKANQFGREQIHDIRADSRLDLELPNVDHLGIGCQCQVGGKGPDADLRLQVMGHLLPPDPPTSPAPFLIRTAAGEYHFWFFGYTAKLPFEREVTRRHGGVI